MDGYCRRWYAEGGEGEEGVEGGGGKPCGGAGEVEVVDLVDPRWRENGSLDPLESAVCIWNVLLPLLQLLLLLFCAADSTAPFLVAGNNPEEYESSVLEEAEDEIFSAVLGLETSFSSTSMVTKDSISGGGWGLQRRKMKGKERKRERECVCVCRKRDPKKKQPK